MSLASALTSAHQYVFPLICHFFVTLAKILLYKFIFISNLICKTKTWWANTNKTRPRQLPRMDRFYPIIDPFSTNICRPMINQQSIYHSRIDNLNQFTIVGSIGNCRYVGKLGGQYIGISIGTSSSALNPELIHLGRFWVHINGSEAGNGFIYVEPSGFESDNGLQSRLNP